MALFKHSRKRKLEEEHNEIPENMCQTLLLFKSYAVQLDKNYDKFERLSRKSRDLAIECQRIMVLLNRIDGPENKDEVLYEARYRLSRLVLTVLHDIRAELRKNEILQYMKAFTKGLDEFVEAVTYYYYLRDDDNCYFYGYCPIFEFLEDAQRDFSEETSKEFSCDNDQQEEYSETDENLSPTLQAFRTYSKELDYLHDKYERITRRSRDLRIESKRIIFLLHRVDGSEEKEEILNEAQQRLSKLVQNVINAIGAELTKIEVYDYVRGFTNGMQEFVEAVSFYYYIKYNKLITLEECRKLDFLDETYNADLSEESSKIPETPNQESILPLSEFLTPVDYILGIADLTGELMRKCINCSALGDFEEPFRITTLLRKIYVEFLLCDKYNLKDFDKKLSTLKCSVSKVEHACYRINIRKAETQRLAQLSTTKNEK